MRYRVNHQWPVCGGSVVIPGGSIIDESTNDFVRGVIPPPDATPLDQATRDWLVSAYRGHTNLIQPVEEQKEN